MKKHEKNHDKKRCLLCGVLLAGAVMLTGCGEEPYELEDSEREIIVNYAAHIIAKYNVRQPEGYRYVYVSDDDWLKVPEAEEESALEDEKPETDQSDGDQSDEDRSEENEEDSDHKGSSGDASADTDKENDVTLSEALGLTDVSAVYTGAEITDHYESVVPNAGNRLMILHVTLQNQSGTDVECDLLSALPTFKARINDIEDSTAEITILPENLSTFEGTIPAGSSVDTIIMFQLKNSEITSLEQLQMYVTANQNTKKVIFL